MAGEFEVDVQDGNDLGGFVINDDGHFQVGGLCCPEATCAECWDLLNAATVTATVSAPGAPCDEAAGAYSFWLSDDGAQRCIWYWTKTDPCDMWVIVLLYSKQNGSWCAYAVGSDDCTGNFADNSCTGAENLQLVDAPNCAAGSGQTIMEFTLIGVEACDGKTMTVTVAAA